MHVDEVLAGSDLFLESNCLILGSLNERTRAMFAA